MPYEPSGFALQIFQSRHAAHDKESWQEGCERVAVHVSNAESGNARGVWRERFADALKDNLLMPGGRIWYGSGRAKGQLLNCVSGDTLVHTRQGLIKARDLHGVVDTLSQGGVYRPATWRSFGVQELCRVEFDNGDILEATSGHQWVVTTAKDGRSDHGDERVPTTALEGRRVPLQHLSPSERVIDNDHFRAGVRHGLIFGDGSVNHTGKSQIIQFGDSRHLVSDYFDKYSTQYHARYPEGVLYSGAHDPTLKTALPTIESNGASYVFGFIAGYVGADGNVCKNGVVTLHGAKYADLVGVRQLASALGIPTVSLKMVREINPWNGERAPLYCLRFAKSGIDPRMIIKNSHRDYLANSPVSGQRTTIKVVSVRSTGRAEEVYCCDEPSTHTWVAGHGYLTGNCFITPAGDSREAWGRTVSDCIVITGTGGGVGINCSPVRPRGTPVRGTGGVATGAVSLMEIINAAGEVIKAGGGRRTALMLALGISHGDIVEFLDKKLNLDQLNNANVSVVFDEDPELFFAAVREGRDWPLTHQGNQIGSIPAATLWQRLVQNALKGGEPGLLNGYLANKMSSISYREKLIITNPCGELWLAAYDACCLGALVLPRFVHDGEVDWDLLKHTVVTGVRFLDDVLTVNQYPLPEIGEKCAELRRIGLGIMGLHHMLLELGLKYNAPSGLEFVDGLMKKIKNWSYEASSDIAAEKGSFPAYDSDQFLKGAFIKMLKPTLREKIRMQGIRNCALNTIAPTGTTAIICDVSSGIEPIYSAAHIRKYQTGTTPGGEKIFAEETLVDPMFQRFVNEGRGVKHFVGAHDLSIRDHMEMQRVCQRHLDNACSKTIQVPANTPWEELSELFMEFLPDLKGVTVYPDGSRENQPLTPLPLDQAIELAKEAKAQASSADACRIGGDCG